MQLRAAGHRVVVQWASETELRACVAAFNYANRDIAQFYKLVPHRALGTGRASKVVFAFDVATGVHAAVKIVSKESARPSDRVFAEREVSIRSSVQHPALVQTLDIFESPADLHLVMEFMSGGTLARRLSLKRAPLDEPSARIVMARTFCALRHLHSRGVVHRNVKPANLLLDDPEDARWAHTVKLSDLSLACRVDDPDAALAVVGTPDFLAPEASTMTRAADGSGRVQFGTQVDMWAAGVTLYNLLSLELPFDAPSAPQVLRNVRSGAFDFDSPAFENISEQARSLIRALLNPDPAKRLTAAAAPHHPWFGSNAARTVAPRPAPRRSNVIKNLVAPLPSRALVRLRVVVNVLRAVARIIQFVPVGVPESPPPPAAVVAAAEQLKFDGSPSLGVQGVASFVSAVGGVDISPRRPRALTPPASSRISNSSTVLSRSSASASDELNSPPATTAVVPPPAARPPRAPSPGAPGWRSARVDVFARAGSFRREKSAGPPPLRWRDDSATLTPSISHPTLSQPSISVRVLSAPNSPRRDDGRIERAWSLRDGWEMGMR